jgi:hypothetical protein
MSRTSLPFAEPSTLVGTSIEKEFPGLGKFKGRITGFYTSGHGLGEETIYTVDFSGEEERISEEELRSIMRRRAKLQALESELLGEQIAGDKAISAGRDAPQRVISQAVEGKPKSPTSPLMRWARGLVVCK